MKKFFLVAVCVFCFIGIAAAEDVKPSGWKQDELVRIDKTGKVHKNPEVDCQVVIEFLVRNVLSLQNENKDLKVEGYNAYKTIANLRNMLLSRKAAFDAKSDRPVTDN